MPFGVLELSFLTTFLFLEAYLYNMSQIRWTKITERMRRFAVSSTERNRYEAINSVH